MKKLLVILALISVINVTAFNASARLFNPKKKFNIEYSTKFLAPVTPQFTLLEGNIFLAIKTDEYLEAVDGDIIEFVFKDKTKLISFHINDSNQELIDTGSANLFVMIHQDLALRLRSTRLKEINLHHDNQIINIPVDDFWIPGKNISQPGNKR